MSKTLGKPSYFVLAAFWIEIPFLGFFDFGISQIGMPLSTCLSFGQAKRFRKPGVVGNVLRIEEWPEDVVLVLYDCLLDRLDVF